jgi:MFS family permease
MRENMWSSLIFPSNLINYSSSPPAPSSPVKGIARKYSAFVRQPGVAPLLAVALVSRMPIGMVGFSMLMFLREQLGSFALAGTVVGVNFVAMSIAAPIQGRLIDRFGPRLLLAVTTVVQPLALLGVLLATRSGASLPLAVACAALAGAFASPITTLTRTLWRHRFEREDDRRTAFALDAVMIELNFTLGPAIMAATLAAASATAAFAGAIGAVVVAAAIFLGSPALRYFPREHASVQRHMLGPLTDARLRLLFAATFGLSVCFGLLEVGYPAYATALAAPAMGGLLLSVNSVGSAIGGAIYGGLQLRAPVERQYAFTLATMALPFFLHALMPPPALFAFVAFLAGAGIAPSIAAQSVLVSRLSPPHYATEAFTWSSTFIVSGIGAGMAMGGFLVEHVGLATAFAVGGVVVALMSMLSLRLPVPRTAAVPAD